MGSGLIFLKTAMQNVSNEATFLTGVIEGFYGPPWSSVERMTLFDWMRRCGFNTYMYAPKDDLKHRAQWRQQYTQTEAADLQTLIRAASEHGLEFLYALSPGLDITYSSTADHEALQGKLAQVLSLGAKHFCLLFDDIPDQMHPEDSKRWTSLAAAQASTTNAIFLWIRQQEPSSRFLFCPTPYCGRMAMREHGGKNYLAILGQELLPEIDVFWTGSEIIPEEITVQETRDLASLLRRKPVVWENLHANDYDGRRFYCGPYSGRPPELRQELAGLLCNPNCEFPVNFVPWLTLGKFLHGSPDWNPRQAYLEAMREWHSQFLTAGAPISYEDLVLFGDCHYLPYESGPEAEILFDLTRKLLQGDPLAMPDILAQFRERSERLRSCCARMAELINRPLFNAIHRRVWELREEIDLLQRCIEHRANPAIRHTPFRADFHLPHTYRGSFVAHLQKFLVQEADGAFTVAQSLETKRSTPETNPA